MKFKVDDLAKAKHEAFGEPGPGWVKPGSIVAIRAAWDPNDPTIIFECRETEECHAIRVSFASYDNDSEAHCACQFDHLSDGDLAEMKKRHAKPINGPKLEDIFQMAKPPSGHPADKILAIKETYHV